MTGWVERVRGERVLRGEDGVRGEGGLGVREGREGG